MSAASTTSADALRERGNEAFKAGKWPAAVDLYSQAIVAAPRDAKAWNNRALAYLKMGLPMQAWGDAFHVQDCLDPGNVKAILRMATALEALQRFTDARAAYAKCGKLKLTAAEAEEVAARATACEAAQEEATEAARRRSVIPSAGAHTAGVVPDPAKHRLPAMMELAPRHSHGAFRAFKGGPRDPAVVLNAFQSSLTHDCIKLAILEGKGVGVVATNHIPAGTLVYVDAPIVAAVLDEGACYHCLLPLASRGKTAGVPCSGGCDRRYCSASCEGQAARMYHAPLCKQAGGKAVSHLEAHASRGTSSSSRFVLLAWKMLGWTLTQCRNFHVPLRAPADLGPFSYLARPSDWATADSGDVQLFVSSDSYMNVWEVIREQLDDDLRCSPVLSVSWVHEALKMIGVNSMGVMPGGRLTSLLACGSALCGAGSMFNHSCAANTMYTSNMAASGYLIFFKTMRDVAAGEELCIGYCSGDAPFEERQMRLSCQYAFKCTCPVCAADVAAGKVARSTAGVVMCDARL